MYEGEGVLRGLRERILFWVRKLGFVLKLLLECLLECCTSESKSKRLKFLDLLY
jgi:hypothetical protein